MYVYMYPLAVVAIVTRLFSGVLSSSSAVMMKHCIDLYKIKFASLPFTPSLLLSFSNYL